MDAARRVRNWKSTLDWEQASFPGKWLANGAWFKWQTHLFAASLCRTSPQGRDIDARCQLGPDTTSLTRTGRAQL